MKKNLTSFFLLLLIDISSLSQERTLTENRRPKEYSAIAENIDEIYKASPVTSAGCLQGKFVGGYISIPMAQRGPQVKCCIIYYAF